MKTRFVHLSRLFLIVLMQAFSVATLSAQGSAFRIMHEWNFSLDYEQYRDLIVNGLAVLEQERPRLCRYIDAEATPQVSE